MKSGKGHKKISKTILKQSKQKLKVIPFSAVCLSKPLSFRENIKVYTYFATEFLENVSDCLVPSRTYKCLQGIEHRCIITVVTMQWFSFQAPQQPKNEMKKMTNPTTIRTMGAAEPDAFFITIVSFIETCTRIPTMITARPQSWREKLSCASDIEVNYLIACIVRLSLLHRLIFYILEYIL